MTFTSLRYFPTSTKSISDSHCAYPTHFSNHHENALSLQPFCHSVDHTHTILNTSSSSTITLTLLLCTFTTFTHSSSFNKTPTPTVPSLFPDHHNLYLLPCQKPHSLFSAPYFMRTRHIHHSASSACAAQAQGLHLPVCGRQVWPASAFGLAGAHNLLLLS